MKKQRFVMEPVYKHLLIGVFSGLAVTLIIMLICALLLTLKDFEASVATPLSNICLSIGAFFGGFVAAYIHKSKGLIIGGVSGLLLFAIITVIALFVNLGNVSINTLIRLVFMVITSVTGGVIGVNLSAKRKMI